MAFPAWVLGHDPSARIVCASYAQELTGETLHETAGAVIEEPVVQATLSESTRLDPRKNTETEFETTARGSSDWVPPWEARSPAAAVAISSSSTTR